MLPTCVPSHRCKRLRLWLRLSFILSHNIPYVPSDLLGQCACGAASCWTSCAASVGGSSQSDARRTLHGVVRPPHRPCQCHVLFY